jgi:hypothetical protein
MDYEVHAERHVGDVHEDPTPPESINQLVVKVTRRVLGVFSAIAEKNAPG